MINGFSDYRAYNGIAADAFTAVLFAFKSRGIQISAVDQAITMRLTLADGTYGDEVTYDPFQMAFPFGPIFYQATGFMVKNATPGIVASYEVVIYR